MPSFGMLRRVALVRTDVSKERSASIIRVTIIGEPGTTLVVTSNRRTLHMGSYKSHTTYHPQKTALFIVTAVETSNLT
jgi:hypothetical protein